MGSLQCICTDKTVWRSRSDHAVSCCSSSTYRQVEHLLQSVNLRWDELSGKLTNICINILLKLYLPQFRAAWRRIFGIEKPQVANIDTTIHQLSDASSQVIIECTFRNFDRKKKLKNKDLLCMDSVLTTNSKIKSTEKNVPSSNASSIKSVPVYQQNEVFRNPSKAHNEIKYSEKLKLLLEKDFRANESGYELRMFSSEVNIWRKSITQIVRTHKSLTEIFNWR